MIAHQELIDRVAAHDEVADSEEARRAVHAVVAALSPHLVPRAREELRQELPRSLRNNVGGTGAAFATDSGALARRVGEDLHCPPEHGLQLTRTVLSEIALASPGLGEDLAVSLPEDLAEWVRDPVGAQGRSDTGATGAPSRLDEATLSAARERLPDWEGDTRRLTRSVRLPKDRIPPLLARVDRLCRDLNSSPHHETTDDGIVFTVQTASVGAVTTQDIELAERVDRAVAEVGSGG
ncbi:DUF2267 domain-containing protein [Thermobifida halotolerans]|uniref:Putative pterin-4-alpha-carbinolamine dehydratase n=1 Tax=Thermobifida halotolerans TaxID=483545 RepID=A0A399GA80_9ACTN|nr:DUF2267 domain-containing protein [Thermobifida halotolerans]UOE20637.1 DUF2267 domain-containing protein [Thermobifida halotolerans]